MPENQISAVLIDWGYKAVEEEIVVFFDFNPNLSLYEMSDFLPICGI